MPNVGADGRNKTPLVRGDQSGRQSMPNVGADGRNKTPLVRGDQSGRQSTPTGTGDPNGKENPPKPTAEKSHSSYQNANIGLNLADVARPSKDILHILYPKCRKILVEAADLSILQMISWDKLIENLPPIRKGQLSYNRSLTDRYKNFVEAMPFLYPFYASYVANPTNNQVSRCPLSYHVWNPLRKNYDGWNPPLPMCNNTNRLSPEELMQHINDKHGREDKGLFVDILRASLPLLLPDLVAPGTSRILFLKMNLSESSLTQAFVGITHHSLLDPDSDEYRVAKEHNIFRVFQSYAFGWCMKTDGKMGLPTVEFRNTCSADTFISSILCMFVRGIIPERVVRNETKSSLFFILRRVIDGNSTHARILQYVTQPQLVDSFKSHLKDRKSVGIDGCIKFDVHSTFVDNFANTNILLNPQVDIETTCDTCSHTKKRRINLSNISPYPLGALMMSKNRCVAYSLGPL
jgi:hypothetical protein